MNATIEWLLQGPSWVRYPTLVDLLELRPEDAEVVQARQAVAQEPQVHALLSELDGWPTPALRGHNDASHLLHKITFLAEVGLTAESPAVGALAGKLLANQSSEGPFRTLLRVPESYGGTGRDQLAWMLCDAPQLLNAVVRFGLEHDPRVAKATAHLTGLAQASGWPCVVAPEFGRFRGPGRKADPCPYATLLALKALSAIGGQRDGEACRHGAATLLELWEQRRERRPYLFAMGTGFARLKAPLLWYDLLHVTEVLTRFPWLHSDSRLREMVSALVEKADIQGRYTPESIWTAWKGWEFGQKREPSRWVTLQVLRVLMRLD